MWARASLFRRFADTNVYGTGFFYKIRKTRHEMSVDIRMFLQCVLPVGSSIIWTHKAMKLENRSSPISTCIPTPAAHLITT